MMSLCLSQSGDSCGQIQTTRKYAIYIVSLATGKAKEANLQFTAEYDKYSELSPVFINSAAMWLAG